MKTSKTGVPEDAHQRALLLRKLVNEVIDKLGVWSTERAYTDRYLSELKKTGVLVGDAQLAYQNIVRALESERKVSKVDLMPIRNIVDQLPTFKEAPQGIDANLLRAIEALDRSVGDDAMFRMAVRNTLSAPRPQEEVLENVET